MPKYCKWTEYTEPTAVSHFSNPQSARSSVSLSVRTHDGSWLPVQGVLDSGASISCGSVYHHALGYPVEEDKNCGTLLSDANGRRIPITGSVRLDISIKLEGIAEPVIVRGMRIYLIRNKQWKNLLLGCDLLAKLNLLPWQTLATRVTGLKSPNACQMKIADTTDQEKVEEFHANTVEDTEIQMLEPAELIVTDDIQGNLEDLQRKLYFQKKVEGLIKPIYEYLIEIDNWNVKKHTLRQEVFTIKRGDDCLTVAQGSANQYEVEVDPGVKCTVWLPPPFSVPIHMEINNKTLKAMFGRTRFDVVMAYPPRAKGPTISGSSPRDQFTQSRKPGMGFCVDHT